ncbi:uncharacterized membrane protein YozB (DUF420 family) [Bradyrhizobium japonicum]|uniref:hypothetical protein n=1 Tax=Bradyrhizobium japonicum TaxID=375 RepID=UPI0012FE3E0F|nr:hypothetical protein [Bradyrhizobium japonicum]
MSTDRIQTTLADRALALAANVAVFYIGLYVASGNLLPTGGLESVWFLSGLALWFLALLSAPWFVPPKDALANAIGAMAILITADLGATGALKPHLEVMRWTAVICCLASMAGAMVALLFTTRTNDPPSGGFSFGPPMLSARASCSTRHRR